MMKEIQFQRVENELAVLKDSKIPTKFKKFNKEEYIVEVSVPAKLIENENIQKDVNFVIHMLPNFPFSAPQVFCKSPFCFPHICDGRDILEDIIGQNWSASLRLIDIVNKIPLFIKEFLNNLKEGVLVLIGNYYLGEKYDLSFLETLPIFIRKVKETVIIDGKEKEIPKILVVSDIFLLLFDQEKWNKNNLHLTFWSNIRSLVTIKKLIKGDTCRFFWKQKSKKKNFEMVLTIEKSNELVDLMLDRMSRYGINYKVSKHNLGPKEGTIPAIDIETVEKNIQEFEAEAELNPDMEKMQYLMSLYEKAVEFYSATNNPKWEFYTAKIHETLKSPRVKDFLDTEDASEVKNNDKSLTCNETESSKIEETEIPKENRITHIFKEDSEDDKDEKEDKLTQSGTLDDIKNSPKNDSSSPSKEEPETSPTENPTVNEENGPKLEITQDDMEQIDYSDDDEEEELEDS